MITLLYWIHDMRPKSDKVALTVALQTVLIPHRTYSIAPVYLAAMRWSRGAQPALQPVSATGLRLTYPLLA